MTTTATTTAARCVGESSRRGSWGGTTKLGRCTRPVAFAVMGYGRHGGRQRPDLTCQPHLGGLVAHAATQRGSVGRVAVLTVTPAGVCASCGERPDWHDVGADCPPPL